MGGEFERRVSQTAGVPGSRRNVRAPMGTQKALFKGVVEHKRGKRGSKFCIIAIIRYYTNNILVY
jgi:hypothetical protein